ncbi:MAG TPA: hypothetical protein PLY72_23390, partial [Candidatus Obscuribacter sp.]|nr:hypothetical protein [Candidatus Obscuribacter sp.]
MKSFQIVRSCWLAAWSVSGLKDAHQSRPQSKEKELEIDPFAFTSYLSLLTAMLRQDVINESADDIKMESRKGLDSERTDDCYPLEILFADAQIQGEAVADQLVDQVGGKIIG